MAKHLAIFSPNQLIEKIFRSIKTVDGRLTQDRVAPYGLVKKGDTILIKISGGPVLGQVEVDNVLFFELTDGELLGKLRKEYGADMAVDDRFWELKREARFASIIFLTKPKRYLTALKFKKRDRRAWVVVG